MTQPFAIGIDVGGTNLKVGLVDDEGRILGKRVGPWDASLGPDRAIGELVELVDLLLSQAGVGRSDSVGLGIGTPGPLDFQKGTIIHSVNLPGWYDVPIRDSLSRQLDMSVVLDNDANAAAFGESWAGAGREGGDLVMLTLGTGVGAGVVLDGRLLHGHFDNAGELGHMIVEVDGLQCPCGQRGCLEQYSSASAVGRCAEAAIKGGANSSLSTAVRDGASIDAHAVAKAAEGGDELCLRIWNESCAFLAVACVNIQHAFNPEMIVLGGGMAEAGAFLIDRVKEQFCRQTWKLNEDRPTIRAAALAYDAGVIGAAGLAWQQQHTDPVSDRV